MGTIKKELAVAALQNGTVIDHIPSDVLFQVAEILQISRLKTGVTIGNNLDSKRMGKKGIIKVADVTFTPETLNRIAVIAPNAKINIIRDYEIVDKYHVVLDDEICDIVKCNNPKCITNNEPMKTRFRVLNPVDIELQCHYCNKKVNKNNIQLK